MDLNKLVLLDEYFTEEFKDIFVVGPVAQIHINESQHESKASMVCHKLKI